MSKINALVGQEFLRIEQVHDYRQVHFSQYLLNVFNPMVVVWNEQSGHVRRYVAEVRETEETICVVLTDGTTVTIDLSDPAWSGPEALALYLGNDCIAVWT